METTTPTIEKQGEPVVTSPVVKSQFDILETEPIFASEEKPVKPTEPNTTITQTPEELAAAKEIADKAILDAQTGLATKAKEYGLPETATAEEVIAHETKIAGELKVKAVELGLPETATKEEVLAAEKAKNEPEGFVKPEELATGLLGAEDGTWKAMMLANGHEVPADYTEEKGFEAFTLAEQTKHKAEIEKAKTEAQESVLATLKPELRAAIELANAMPDMSIEQILNPTLQIDSWLKLGKEELIREEIKASNPDFTPEMVDIKMQEIKDTNKVDIRYDMIKIGLEKDRVQIQEFQKQKIQEYQNKQTQEKSATEKGKIEQVSKALDRVPSFLDKKLTDIDRQYLRKKIEEGAINDLVSNPEKLAKAITMMEFYDKGVTSYENRVREKLLLEHKKALHNTPTTTTTRGANQVVVTKPITNQFDILKEEFGEK
jgi:hypothetical protein